LYECINIKKYAQPTLPPPPMERGRNIRRKKYERGKEKKQENREGKS
jgi:hypothetical protein